MAGPRLLTATMMLLLVVTGCGDDDQPTAGDDLCDQVAGSSFVSELESSAVMTEDGAVATTEELEYYDDGVDWYSGDTIDSYEWTCADNEVRWTDSFFTARLSLEEGRLVLTEPDDFRWLGPSAP